MLWVVFALFSSASAAPLWGAVGHEVTGRVAQNMLTQPTFDKVRALIPQQNGELALVADWADQVRSQKAFAWSSPLHFADVPDWACDYIHSRDCSNNMCVVGAVSNYTTRQADQRLALVQRVEALKFFVHFTGDIHQPLHVGFLSNLGGNKLTGKFMGKSTNLHSLWDSGLINVALGERFHNDPLELSDYLWKMINGDWKQNATQWRQCSRKTPYSACPDDWANESAELACNHAYVGADGHTRIQNNFNLDRDYYDRNIDVVLGQLAKSGVRMANVLNFVYDPKQQD